MLKNSTDYRLTLKLRHACRHLTREELASVMVRALDADTPPGDMQALIALVWAAAEERAWQRARKARADWEAHKAGCSRCRAPSMCPAGAVHALASDAAFDRAARVSSEVDKAMATEKPSNVVSLASARNARKGGRR